ncbi:ankyrin repeat-containing protein-like [Dorcoceras hygrometricum]|uniref:Ankyrin repeat-containing protein-like n=1 Tax=Dorcoceras hygrometricum TaxID=472368 RepID=A0A2Z7DGS4_9LAMI|nr:ankyrin repeat-containing protein-like [Dorcoceras hygrometricum]
MPEIITSKFSDLKFQMTVNFAKYGNQTKRFDKIVQQQITVAKSMWVNTTVACDWLNFEFQSLRLILVSAGGWWLARTIERIHERVTRGKYCYACRNQQQEFPLCNCWLL